MRHGLIALLISALLIISLQLRSDPPNTQQLKLNLVDSELLTQLENAGLGFHQLIAPTALNRRDTASLYRQSYYRSIVDSLSADLDALLKKDSRLSVTMAKAHRLFNKNWLKSSEAHFELVGVINRLDRQPFNTHYCGEVRLIYRLAYRVKRKTLIASRLPFAVNMVYWINKDKTGRCAQAAKQWLLPNLPNTQLVKWLRSNNGPLSPKQINHRQLKAVEINMQSVRWPSTVRPKMAGYAEYIMRVFKANRAQKRYGLASMENMPDIQKLRDNPRLRKQLLQWLTRPDTIKAIDAGTVKIPNRFLAKKATSFALHGMARKANRPFDQLFSATDFQTIRYRNRRYVKSPYALLRRLNDMSCVGCHQGRSIAGFHFVGIDRTKTSRYNYVYNPGSPHFLRDKKRRALYLTALLTNKRPDPARPFSERADHDEGDFGSHCALGNKEFKHWTCKQGLSCRAYDTSVNSKIGRCYPTIPKSGSPCQVARVSQHRNPLRDKMINFKQLSCTGVASYCLDTRGGFPGGLCSAPCVNLKPGETCGGIAALDGFNGCLARGKPFDQCLEKSVLPMALQACDHKNACRDDYICARTPKNKGACIPPYFLFQLRVDGHPKPRL